MMKANELMIGDWVALSFDLLKDDCPPFEAKLNLKNIVAVNDGKLVAHPIPLTEEMLKANGFEEIYMDTEFDIVKYLNFMIYKRKPNSNYPVRKYFSSICCCEFEINYVHELQHALRLCGLNKLADNFKIK